jgi:hypothetical protein
VRALLDVNVLIALLDSYARPEDLRALKNFTIAE